MFDRNSALNLRLLPKQLAVNELNNFPMTTHHYRGRQRGAVNRTVERDAVIDRGTTR